MHISMMRWHGVHLWLTKLKFHEHTMISLAYMLCKGAASYVGCWRFFLGVPGLVGIFFFSPNACMSHYVTLPWAEPAFSVFFFLFLFFFTSSSRCRSKPFGASHSEQAPTGYGWTAMDLCESNQDQSIVFGTLLYYYYNICLSMSFGPFEKYLHTHLVFFCFLTAGGGQILVCGATRGWGDWLLLASS